MVDVALKCMGGNPTSDSHTDDEDDEEEDDDDDHHQPRM